MRGFQSIGELSGFLCRNLEDQDSCKEAHADLCEYDECCFGEYDVDGDTEEWPGEGNECIGGLGQTSWKLFDDDGFPAIQISQSRGSGVIATYEIERIIDVLNVLPAFSFITANYWDGIEEGSESDRPKFYLSDQGSGSYIDHMPLPKDGNPYITWSCKDRGYEVKHRIHLIIREWNTQEEFLLFKDSEGNRGDPDNVGDEGAVCDYYEQDKDNLYQLSDGQCNDAVDVDDWKDHEALGDLLNNLIDGYDYPYPELAYD